MESTMRRFWKYTDTKIQLEPVDEEQPRLGGRVTVSERALNVQTMVPTIRTLHGVYGEDFLTYAQFDKEVDTQDEEALLRLFDETAEEVLDVHSFKFENGKLSYARRINPFALDAEIEHEISETELNELIEQTWTEKMFYGIGNEKMTAYPAKR